MRALIATASVLWLVELAAGQEFHRQFLSLVGTKPERIFNVEWPLLVDTNNTTLKLAGAALDLRKAVDMGQIGTVRLGMTMEEVVAAWGKPPILYSRCLGGPRFYYSDVNVIFEPASNCVKRIVLIEKFPALASSLSASSPMEDFIRVLGKPTAQKDDADVDEREMAFETAAGALKIRFINKRLLSIQLDGPSGGPRSKP